jgi:hypothetical protein
MAYHFEWLVPERVIFHYLSATQDMAAARQSLAELTARLDVGKAPTHYVADLRHNQKLPTTNIREIQMLSSFVHHPHLGWIVVIGRGNPTVNFVLTVVARLTGVRYRAVDTPQDAVAFLSTIDPTLNLDVDLEAFYAKFMESVRNNSA